MSEYIKIDDIVRFTQNFYHPVSGFSSAADSTPRWYVYEDNEYESFLEGEMVARSGIAGSYRGDFTASTANGFVTDSFYDVQVSGTLDGTSAFNSVKQFKLGDIYDTNVVQVSGETVTSSTSTYDANIISVSGENVDIRSFNDMSIVNPDIYFAHIKYIYDGTNNSDEFAVQWFKNDQPTSSGNLTNPTLSVYNTTDGTAVINNVSMNYISTNLGTVRHNETPNIMASGEPYLVETSGTIDSNTKVWKSIVGLDYI